MKGNDELVTLKCEKCGTEYQIKLKTKNNRIKKGTPMYCKNCMNEYLSKIRKEYFSKLSPEEQKEFIDKRNWYSRLSPEEKEAHAQRTRDQLAKRTPEEWAEINKKNSEGLKKHWATVSDKDKEKRVTPMIEANREILSNMTPEELSERAKKIYNSIPEGRRKYLSQQTSERITAYNNSISYEEKLKRAKNMQDWHNNLSNEEKAMFYKRTHQWVYDLTEEEREILSKKSRKWWDSLSKNERTRYSNMRKDWWKNLSIEERIKLSEKHKEYWNNLPENEKKRRIKKALSRSSSKKGSENELNKRFEKVFNTSELSKYLYYIREYPTCNNGIVHSWDYGLFDENGELVIIIDLDGEFYHADTYDYSGMQSKEECDENRGLSIPNNIIHCMIYEFNFDKSFKYMEKIISLSYDEYTDRMFKECKLVPFHYPSYNIRHLLKTYRYLLNMKCDDKYHKSLSLNTRLGDKLIYNFHHSIWHARFYNKLSPYNAWHDDDILYDMINTRIIFHSYLNPNKILQGFNISPTAQRVPFMSGGRAKMIIYRYLNEYDTIFDPFSGFSGRMLGAISLGKRYIGQDISEIHVRESNEMMEFLHEYGVKFDAEITQHDILQSSGTYQCLFTCPPYGDKEVWENVVPDTRTCDDWIDECIKRFKCKRYVFVVDTTNKYVENVVDTIENKYLFQDNEYIVIIEGV